MHRLLPEEGVGHGEVVCLRAVQCAASIIVLGSKFLASMGPVVSVSLPSDVTIKIAADHQSLSMIDGAEVAVEGFPEFIFFVFRAVRLGGVAREDMECC